MVALQMTEPRVFHDAFPSDGLTAQYKPFILVETRRYCRRYKLPMRVLLPCAVSISLRAEETFDRQRGNGFVAYLTPRLQRLNRIAQDHLTCLYGRPRWRRQPKLSYRQRAIRALNQCPIRWEEHREHLRRLAVSGLKPIEAAILAWMIDPADRTLTQLAEANGITKGWASKIRYRLLLSSHSPK